MNELINTNVELSTTNKVTNLISNIDEVNSNVPMMSSKEVATLCEKEHKHVIRDIKNTCVDLKFIDGPNLDHVYYQGLRVERE